jgi:hypothetical protein
MQRSFPLFLLGLVLLGPSAALAGNVSASMSSTQIHVGEAATLEVQVVGAFAGQPKLKDVSVASIRMIGQHSRTTLRRGRASQVHTFTYRVTGRVAGKATLGPAKIEVDGRELRSEYFQIEVLPRRTGQARRQQRPGPANAFRGGQAQGRSSRQQPEPSEDYYATASFSAERPWVGQSILYTVEVGSSTPPRDIEWEPPGFSPLSAEPNLGLTQTDEQKIIDGQRYTVNTITVPVFGIETGRVKIGAAQFVMALGRGRGFFGGSRQVPFNSNEVELEVRPLPTVGIPDHFSGAVGNYQIEINLDRASLDAGETATLTVEIVGSGALRGEKLHIVVPEGIRAYDEKPEVNSALRVGRVQSRAVYRTTLVPLEPGSYEIGPLSFSFFEPEAGSYRTVLSRTLKMNVGGNAVTDAVVIARSASLGRAKEEVEILGVDILPLHGARRIRGNHHLSPTTPWLLALLGLPFLGLLGLASLAQRQRFAGTAAGQDRQRRSAGRSALKEAAVAAKAGDSDGAIAALKAYLVARLGPRGAALGPSDAASVLEAEGVSAEVAGQLTALLVRLEGVRYGGAEARGLDAAIAQWLTRCEKDWR